MKDELPGKIAKWLKVQGYPLEMTVAAALRKDNFYTNQGFYYSDPETNTSREIDIIATKTDAFGLFQVEFVVECKSSLDKPWVLFTSDSNELGKNIFQNYAMLSNLADKKLRHKLFTGVTDKNKENDKASILSLPWLKQQSQAYGVAAAFSSGSSDDPAYKAIMSALKAALYLNRSQEENNPYSLRFVFPIVVLDGRLFEAFLSSDGKTVIREVKEGFVSYFKTIAGFPCCAVHLITADKLTSFCREAMEAANQIEVLLKSDIEEMSNNLSKTSSE